MGFEYFIQIPHVQIDLHDVSKNFWNLEDTFRDLNIDSRLF
jgi:hypothetical protein